VPQLAAAHHILVLTDYDGTLTPIVERPDMATLSKDVGYLLEDLSHQSRLALGVISGRALADLKNKVMIKDIVYAGNHGLEIEGPGIAYVHPIAQEFRPILRAVHHFLTRALATIRGILIENKDLSLSIHYRLVEESEVLDVQRAVRLAVDGTHGKARLAAGKKVYEVRPSVNWDKGKAIRLLIKEYGRTHTKCRLLPMYFGDDLTDEDGFRAIQDYSNGISDFVGEQGQSAARYYLRSPAEVALFLNMLLRLARRGFKSVDSGQRGGNDENPVCSIRSQPDCQSGRIS